MTDKPTENPTTTPEATPEVAPETERPIGDQLDTLLRESFDRFSELESEGVALPRIGKNRMPFVPYDQLEQEGISKTEYYNIMVHWLEQSGTDFYRVGENRYPFVFYENLGEQDFDAKKYYDQVAKTYEAEGIQFVRLGELDVPIPKYTDIEQGAMTPEEYFDVVSDLVATPGDIAEVLNDPNLVWHEVAMENGVELLYEPQDVLAKGTGDCDNISWVGKELFDRLEIKTDESYDARVIGIYNYKTDNGHAFLTYINPEGELCAIDQGKHKTDIRNVRSGTDLLQNPDLIDKRSTHLLQIEKIPGGSSQHSLRAASDEDLGHQIVEKDFKFLILNLRQDYSEDFSPRSDKHPSDWDLYETTHFRFIDGTRLVYNNIDGSMFLAETHHSVDDERDATFYRKSGAFDQIQFKDGVILYYDESGTTLDQITFPEGFALFEPVGTLKQVTFNEGPVDFHIYHPDGKTLKQRNFRSEEYSPYRVVMYNEAGEINYLFPWEGEKIRVENPEDYDDEIFKQKYYPLETNIEDLINR